MAAASVTTAAGEVVAALNSGHMLVGRCVAGVPDVALTVASLISLEVLERLYTATR